MAVVVDSYSETNQDADSGIKNTHPSADGNCSAFGQTLTGDGRRLYSCEFYLKKVGSPGNLIARLYAHTGTWGSAGTPTGDALDNSDTIAASGISTSYGLVLFTGLSGYVLVNGTKYCIVAEAYDGTWDSTTNYVYAGRDDSTSTHDGNLVQYYNSAWGANSAMDTCFYVYGIGGSLVYMHHCKSLREA